MKKAAIVCVGNELLNGWTVDTNSSYLSGQLFATGVMTQWVCHVGDVLDEIVEAIGIAAHKADYIFLSGGLGPTDDDLTREALSEFLGVELEFHGEILADIQTFFDRRGIEMNERNRSQAYLPAGTTMIQNRTGTAPAIWADYEGKAVICLPGVPVELRTIYREEIEPRIVSQADDQAVRIRRLRCFGPGESALALKLGDRMKRDRNPLVNCTVGGGVITLHVIGIARDQTKACDLVDREAQEICEILGEVVYGEDDQTLQEVTGQMLRQKGKRIAVAESCTGGLLAKMLTDVPGSSDYFTYGWVTYSNEAKIKQLAVDAALIERYGAVSEETARAMALGALKNSNADISVAITGIAGPEGGTEQKPVGTVYIAVADSGETTVEHHVYPGGREKMRTRTVHTALNCIRLKMLV